MIPNSNLGAVYQLLLDCLLLYSSGILSSSIMVAIATGSLQWREREREGKEKERNAKTKKRRVGERGHFGVERHTLHLSLPPPSVCLSSLLHKDWLPGASPGAFICSLYLSLQVHL